MDAAQRLEERVYTKYASSYLAYRRKIQDYAKLLKKLDRYQLTTKKLIDFDFDCAKLDTLIKKHSKAL